MATKKRNITLLKKELEARNIPLYSVMKQMGIKKRSHHSKWYMRLAGTRTMLYEEYLEFLKAANEIAKKQGKYQINKSDSHYDAVRLRLTA